MNLFKLCAIVAVATLLPGCAAFGPTTPKVVKVPVALTCQIPVMPPRPNIPLPVAKDATPADTVRAYKASVQILQGYALSLEQLLGGFSVPASSKK